LLADCLHTRYYFSPGNQEVRSKVSEKNLMRRLWHFNQ
jgi:hypothetical protein